jgi:purine nucleoside phosphorylase
VPGRGLAIKEKKMSLYDKVVGIEEVRRVLRSNFGSEQVKIASVGGSGTWGIRFPEDLPGKDMPTVVFHAPVQVTPDFDPIPAVRILSLTAPDGQVYPIIRVSYHGWTFAGRCPDEANSVPVFMLLHELGVERVLVDASVGAISNCDPWDLVLIDDLYATDRARITRMVNRYAASIGRNLWVRMWEVYCPECRAVLKSVVEKALAEKNPQFSPFRKLVDHGVYVNKPVGPFETATEIRVLKQQGATIVGQSSGIEAMLSRVSGMCFSGLYIPVNYAEGLESAGWTPDMSMKEIYERIATPMGHLVVRALTALATTERTCQCRELSNSVDLQIFPVQDA